MSTDITIVRCVDFMRTTATGELDYEASKALLTDIARTMRAKRVAKVLLDVRHANPSLSTIQLYDLAGCFASSDLLRTSRTALLTVDGPRFDDAQFVENVVFNRGGALAAFTSFEEAMDWLVFEESPT